MESQAIQGYITTSNDPVISHLLFVDDTIIFCGAKEGQVRTIKEILQDYERATGQQVNFTKTNVLFSKGVRTDTRSCINDCLDI